MDATTQTTIHELDALAGEAAQADAGAAPTPAPEATTGEAGQVEQQQPPADPQAEAAGIVGMIAWGIEQLFPMIEYTEETKKKGAEVLAPLLAKYNVTGTLMGKYAEEFQAGIFFGGLAVGTYKAIKAHNEADETAKAEVKKSRFAKFFTWAGWK